MGRIILYSIVIAIIIVTRLRYLKRTNRKIIVESIFYLGLGSIVVIESIYNAGVPILFLIPYLILFFGFQHYSYIRSNRLISFWKGSKPGSIYVTGWNTYSSGVCDRNNITYYNIYIVYWESIYTNSKRNNLH